jgi:hypothetical protein
LQEITVAIHKFIHRLWIIGYKPCVFASCRSIKCVVRSAFPLLLAVLLF